MNKELKEINLLRRENKALEDDNYQKCEIISELKEKIKKLEHENLGLRQQVDRYGLQYLDDIANPLEPLKLKSALDSEIFKYNYRKEHKPNDINILDITIMYALKHCLEEQIEKQVDQ